MAVAERNTKPPPRLIEQVRFEYLVGTYLDQSVPEWYHNRRSPQLKELRAWMHRVKKDWSVALEETWPSVAIERYVWVDPTQVGRDDYMRERVEAALEAVAGTLNDY